MINIILITKSEKINEYVNSGKKIHPEGYISKKNESANTISLLCRNTDNPTAKAEAACANYTTDTNGIILLCDNSYYNEITKKMGSSLLISKLGDYNQYLDGSVKTKQYLEDKIFASLKVFFWLKQSFENGFGELLRLPIRNFNDDDFKKVCRRVSIILENEKISEEMDEVAKAFSMLKGKLRKPKKRPATSKNFYMDEKNFLFEFGKENHAKHETSSNKGHVNNCDISARFRFGVKIDESKHFNVCRGDTINSAIYGVFVCCHDHEVTIKKTSHINMFSNDYIA